MIMIGVICYLIQITIGDIGFDMITIGDIGFDMITIGDIGFDMLFDKGTKGLI